MDQRCQRLRQVLAVGANLDAQGALARGGQHGGGFEDAADAVGHAQALQARRGENDGVVLAFVQLAQAGVEVAAQGFDLQVGAQRLQQHLAAQAGCADDSALGQGVQVGVTG